MPRTARTEPINIGVIGAGEIAQIMHLPLLREMPEFRLTAICDVSPRMLHEISEQYGVPGRYTRHRELLQDPDVDAVIIATYEHTEIALDAIDAGKHLLIEKPLAFTPEHAVKVELAAQGRPQVAMVGYMKRYDPAYEAARRRIEQGEPPRFVDMHILAGRYDMHRHLYDLVRANDVDLEQFADSTAAVDRSIESALGPNRAHWRELYKAFLMTAIHDLSVLRGLFGSPVAVPYSSVSPDGSVVAILEYSNSITCTFRFAENQHTWWDERLSVHGGDSEVHLEFPYPYLRNSPTKLSYREGDNQQLSRTQTIVSTDSSFRRQLTHFAECIRGGSSPRTPLSEGVRDLEVALQIFQAAEPELGS